MVGGASRWTLVLSRFCTNNPTRLGWVRPLSPPREGTLRFLSVRPKTGFIGPPFSGPPGPYFPPGGAPQPPLGRSQLGPPGAKKTHTEPNNSEWNVYLHPIRNLRKTHVSTDQVRSRVQRGPVVQISLLESQLEEQALYRADLEERLNCPATVCQSALPSPKRPQREFRNPSDCQSGFQKTQHLHTFVSFCEMKRSTILISKF